MGNGLIRECSVNRVSPIDGTALAEVITVTNPEVDRIIGESYRGFRLEQVPAPRRGQIVKEIGIEIAAKKTSLAELITLEMGKCLRESLGEVQEMIDVFDFAVGLTSESIWENDTQ